MLIIGEKENPCREMVLNVLWVLQVEALWQQSVLDHTGMNHSGHYFHK